MKVHFNLIQFCMSGMIARNLRGLSRSRKLGAHKANSIAELALNHATNACHGYVHM